MTSTPSNVKVEELRSLPALRIKSLTIQYLFHHEIHQQYHYHEYSFSEWVLRSLHQLIRTV